MTGQYIPKEQLTAYERWEMAAFDEAEQLTRSMRDAETAAQAKMVGAPAVDAPPALSEAQIAALREQAAQEGREAGFAEGLRNGYAEGRTQGAQAAKSEALRLAETASAFSAALREAETQFAESILQLSLDLARQIICSSLHVRPELVLPVVREAMAALVSQHGHPTLTLNPADAALIRAQIEDQIAHTGWRILEDPTIAPGGCRVDNGGAEVDATLAERWRRVIASLGQDTAWTDAA